MATNADGFTIRGWALMMEAVASTRMSRKDDEEGFGTQSLDEAPPKD